MYAFIHAAHLIRFPTSSGQLKSLVIDVLDRPAMLHLLLDIPSALVNGGIQIVIHLQPKPETCRVPEECTQAQGSIGCHSSLPMNDFINPARRNAKFPPEQVLTYLQWSHELFLEDLTRMYRGRFLSHSTLLVIVDYLNIKCVTPSPYEADTPLIVDPNAMLSLPVALENLKSIPGWHSQIHDA